jgi:hypothetical protein
LTAFELGGTTVKACLFQGVAPGRCAGMEAARAPLQAGSEIPVKRR